MRVQGGTIPFWSPVCIYFVLCVWQLQFLEYIKYPEGMNEWTMNEWMNEWIKGLITFYNIK